MLGRTVVRRRMRMLASGALVATASLVGCTPVGVADAPAGSAPAGAPEPPYLQTASTIFDPVADDVTATVHDEGAAVEISRWFPQDS